MKARIPFDPNDTCRIKIEEYEKGMRHHQSIIMPDGKRIPKVVWTRVYDAADEVPYVIAKILINISAK